jgi:hypothetical protein
MKAVCGIFRPITLFLFILCGIAVPGPGNTSETDSSPFPFAPGEKLHYEVYWLGIKAADAVLQVLPMATVQGKPAWHFGMTAQTSSLVAAIYPVYISIHSWTEADMTRGLRYTEYKRKRFETKNISITFDWPAKTAHTVKNEKKRRVQLKPGAFDPFSIFYFFRTQTLQDNLELTRPVTDRKRCLQGFAHVRGRQTIQSGGREWDTWLVEPDLSRVKHVFEKNPEARFQIWVTADDRRLPVKLKSKIAVGSFTAELVKIDS